MTTPIRTPKRDEAPHTKEAPNTAGTSGSTDFVILEEEIDPNYVPSDTEIEEYAKWLGMDIVADKELFWIAREGLKAPLPKDWKPCKTQDTEEIYYFNFTTGDSTWDHPCDGYYRNMYEENKKKLAKEASNSKSKNGKKDSKRRDVRQASSSSSSDIAAPTNKLDLKPLSLGNIKPILKSSITQQPLPKMGSLEEELEPSGPPPILEIKPKKSANETKTSSITSTKKTLKDVDTIISPRQLLQKSKKSQRSEHRLENKSTTPRSNPSSNPSSPNSVTSTSSQSPASSSASSSSPASGETESSDMLFKSKGKVNGFGSKKFGRGLANALTNSGNRDDSLVEEEEIQQDNHQTISSRATVLRQTRDIGTVDASLDDLQQRESELQERHLKELRQSEEKFNKELSEQRLTLTQSLNDAQDKYKSYKIKCEKHMEKLKKSIECAELEKKSLLEKNVQSGQKIEQLEKELIGKNSSGSDDFTKLRNEYEIKVKELQGQHELKVKKLELSLEESRRCHLISLELVKHHEAVIVEKEAEISLLATTTDKNSNPTAAVVNGDGDNETDRDKEEELVKQRKQAKEEKDEFLISELEKQLLEERRKNEVLCMELKDSQRKCKNLENSLNDFNIQKEESTARNGNVQHEVNTTDDADTAGSKLVERDGTLRMETQLMNNHTCSSLGGGGDDEYTTCESNATKLDHDFEREEGDDQVKPCVDFALNFQDMNIDDFDESMKKHFINDVSVGFGLLSPSCLEQSTADLDTLKEEEEELATSSSLISKPLLSLSILSVAAGSVIVAARINGFEDEDNDVGASQFAIKVSSIDPSSFLDVNRYGEVCYSQLPQVTITTSAVSTASPASSCSLSQTEMITVPSRPAPSIPTSSDENQSLPTSSDENQSIPTSSDENQSLPTSSVTPAKLSRQKVSSSNSSLALLESPVALLPLSPDSNSDVGNDEVISPSSSSSSPSDEVISPSPLLSNPQIRALQSDLFYKTSQLMRAKEELDSVLLEVTELRQKYTKMASERDEESLERKKVARELEAIKLEASNKNSSHASILYTETQKSVKTTQSLNEKISNLLLEKSKLEELCFEKDRSMLDGQSMVDSLSSKMNLLQKELDEKTTSLLKTQSTVDDLERKLSQSLEQAAIADKRATHLAQDAMNAASLSAKDMANAVASAVQATELKLASQSTQLETQISQLTQQLSEVRQSNETAHSKLRAEEAEHSFYESKSHRLETEKQALEVKLASIRSDLEVSSARLHAMQCSSDDDASARRSAETRAIELEKRVQNLIEATAKGEAEASRLREQLNKEVTRLRARDAATTAASSPQNAIESGTNSAFPQQSSSSSSNLGTLSQPPLSSVLTVEEEAILKHQLSIAQNRIQELESELERTRLQLSFAQTSSDKAIQNASLLSAEVAKLENSLRIEKEKTLINTPLSSSSSVSVLPKEDVAHEPPEEISQPPPRVQQQQQQPVSLSSEQKETTSSLERQLSEAALGLIADEGPSPPSLPSHQSVTQVDQLIQEEDRHHNPSSCSKSISDIFCLADHWKSSLEVARSEVLRRKKEVAASQRSLENRRAVWRRARDKQHAQSTATARGLVPGNGKYASLQQAREASTAAKHLLREQRNVLDGETSVLNGHVNELRLASAWLSERGSKLDKLDSLLRTVKRMRKAYGPTSNNNHQQQQATDNIALNDSITDDGASLIKMDGLSFNHGFTGDDTIALTLAEINNLTLDLEDRTAPPRDYNYHHHQDAYDRLGVAPGPPPPVQQSQQQQPMQHPQSYQPSSHYQQEQHQHQYPPPPPPFHGQDQNHVYYQYNNGIENYQPIPNQAQPNYHAQKYNMSTIGPVGFGSGQGRFNYSRPSSSSYSPTNMTTGAPNTTQWYVPPQSSNVNKTSSSGSAAVQSSYSGFRVAMPNGPRSAPSPRRVSHLRSAPLSQQVMSQASMNHHPRGQTASEKLFDDEKRLHATQSGDSAREHLNAAYRNVSKASSKSRISSSNSHSHQKEGGGDFSHKQTWLESLRKDVTSKATTSRSRHSSHNGNHASSSGGATSSEYKKQGLAGAWMVLNEHTFNELENQNRSRVTDALVSPTRRR